MIDNFKHNLYLRYELVHKRMLILSFEGLTATFEALINVVCSYSYS